ncbi:MAG: hypothetical protein ACE5E5_11690 [Phycisphaerae bacterium]
MFLNDPNSLLPARWLAQFAEPSSMDATQFIMLVGAVLGLTLLMLTTRKRFAARAHAKEPSIRQRATVLTRETNRRRDVDAVMIELDKLARQIHAQIDTRFAKLEAVIRDADQRIATLQRLADEAARRPARTAHALDITLGSEAPDLEVSADSPADGGAIKSTSDHQPILDLADQGLSMHEIAERVARPIGEVELILSLHRADRAAQESATPASTHDSYLA